MSLEALESATTALVLIDLQLGITGSPTEPRSPAEVVESAGRLVTASRKAGVLVVFVRVLPDPAVALRPPVDRSFTRGASLPPNWGELVPELSRREGELLITKRQWGAFYGTELDLQLRRRGVRTIILGGISTNMGVESTARDAFERGYHLLLAEDAMAARSAAAHQASVEQVFPLLGRVRTSTEIISALVGDDQRSTH